MRRVCVSVIPVFFGAARLGSTFPDLLKPVGGAATLPQLSYPIEKGILPVISGIQLNLHYNKHHKAYVDKLNQIVPAKYDGKTIEDILVAASKVPEEKVLFNQAAQHFNHTFFWHCLRPGGVAMPEAVKKALTEAFGSVNAFIAQFNEKGISNFGSGWTWLVYDGNSKKLVIENTSNAGCPITESNKVPILVIDVWEHAYYVDYENRRAEFLRDIWNIVDWEFAGKQLEAAK